MVEYNQIFLLDLQQIVVFYILMIFFLNIVYGFRRLYVFADSLPINNGNDDPQDEGFFSKIKKFVKNNYCEILLVVGCVTAGGALYWYLDISLSNVQKGYSLHKNCWQTLKEAEEGLRVFCHLYDENFQPAVNQSVIDLEVAEQLDKIQELSGFLDKLMERNPLEYIVYLDSLGKNPFQSEYYLLANFRENVLINWLDLKNLVESGDVPYVMIDDQKFYYFPPLEEGNNS